MRTLITLALAVALSAGLTAQYSLTTTFASNNGQAGNVFDIQANQTVYVRGFDVNLDPGSFDVEVWARNTLGTHVGFTANPSAWTRVGSYPSTLSAGANVPTALPRDLLVNIPAGQVRAFMVVVTNGPAMNYNNGTAVGNVAASDARIALLEGSGISGPFGALFSPRVFSGTVRYSTVQNVPSPATTIQSRINIALADQVILVQPGVYNENINYLAKDLYLLAAGNVVIDGGNSGPVVSFTGNQTRDAVLDGFTLRNGHGGVEQGGGIDIQAAAPTLRNCTIMNCVGGPASGGGSNDSCAGGIHIDGLEHPFIVNCQILGNQGGPGVASGVGGPGGVWSRREVTIVDSLIENNTGGNNPVVNGTGGPGGLGLGTLGNHTILRCRVLNNHGGVGTRGGTGGIYTRGDSATRVDACVVANNTGGVGTTLVGGAGGVTFDSGGSRLAETYVYGNQGGASVAGQGGAGGINMMSDTGTLILNCSITANTPGVGGGGNGPGGILYFRCINSAGSLRNSIVWGNAGASLLEVLLAVNFAHPTVANCDIEGGWAQGTSILDQDPIFTNVAAGDLRLQAASPCIDQGDGSVFGLSAVDIDGDPRIVGAAPDLGADELTFPILPGTGEDLAMETLINGALGVQAQLGDFLEIRAFSPNGTFVGDVPVVLGQVFTTGTPPGDLSGIGLPEIHMDLMGLLVLFDGTMPYGPFPQYLLPPSGIASYHQLNTGSGSTVRLQTAVLSSSAANGVFAATGAYDVAIQ